MITIRQVEALVWSVRLGTLSRAAQRLNAAQPTISKRLQELETGCGFEIFEKRGRKLFLTEKGKTLNVLAEKIFALTSQVEDLKNDETPVERSISIGVTEFAAHTWVVDLVEQIRSELPHIVPQISIEHCGILRDKLVRGDLDLVVCPSYTHDANISSQLAQEIKFVMVGSPRYFSSDQKYLGHDLAKHSFLTHGPIGAIGAVDTWIADIGWRPNEVVQVDSLVAQIEMARAGMGLAILPEPSVSTLIKSGQLTEIDIERNICSVLYRIYGRKNELSSSLEDIVDIIRDICNFDNRGQYIAERHASNRDQ
ncbi:LysR family transcriptional regulator [Aliiroseovarius sp. S1339]|uniref:LysR family transcriptional regulator n=1 Tax=Aliiroseovarius sp. S1339 TaxID=2936990 RepID=UPI0020C0A566|nr:LysR family transcriptional regulator [Aliiroseovarius sp. S1339]MCK8463169.1 LysR family transcriptional regulator [Aliiroseovarius sp. S1339]